MEDRLNLYKYTIGPLAQKAIDEERAKLKARNDGMMWGAPTARAQIAEAAEEVGDYARAVAHYEDAATNSAGHSRSDMYELDAKRCAQKLEQSLSGKS